MKYDFKKLRGNGIYLTVNSIDISGIGLDISPTIDTTVYTPGGVDVGKCTLVLGNIKNGESRVNVHLRIADHYQNDDIGLRVLKICTSYLKSLGLNKAYVRCSENSISNNDIIELKGERVFTGSPCFDGDDVYSINL